MSLSSAPFQDGGFDEEDIDSTIAFLQQKQSLLEKATSAMQQEELYDTAKAMDIVKGNIHRDEPPIWKKVREVRDALYRCEEAEDGRNNNFSAHKNNNQTVWMQRTDGICSSKKRQRIIDTSSVLKFSSTQVGDAPPTLLASGSQRSNGYHLLCDGQWMAQAMSQSSSTGTSKNCHTKGNTQVMTQGKSSNFHDSNVDKTYNAAIGTPAPGQQTVYFREPQLVRVVSGQEHLKKNKDGSSKGRWTRREHMLFLEGMEKYGRGWKKVAMHIQTRSVVQVRTHAQKYFDRLAEAKKNGEGSQVSMVPRGGYEEGEKPVKKRKPREGKKSKKRKATVEASATQKRRRSIKEVAATKIEVEAKQRTTEAQITPPMPAKINIVSRQSSVDSPVDEIKDKNMNAETPSFQADSPKICTQTKDDSSQTSVFSPIQDIKNKQDMREIPTRIQADSPICTEAKDDSRRLSVSIPICDFKDKQKDSETPMASENSQVNSQKIAQMEDDSSQTSVSSPVHDPKGHPTANEMGVRSPTGVADLSIDIDVDAFMHDDVEDETLDLQIPDGDGIYEGLEPFHSSNHHDPYYQDNAHNEQFLDDDKSIVTPDEGSNGGMEFENSSIGNDTPLSDSTDEEEEEAIFAPLVDDFDDLTEFVLITGSGLHKRRHSISTQNIFDELHRSTATFEDHLKLLQMPIEEEDDKYVSANLFDCNTTTAAEEGPFSILPVTG